jgi:hypothetical protein
VMPRSLAALRRVRLEPHPLELSAAEASYFIDL